MLDLYQEFSPHSAMPPADEQFTEAANKPLGLRKPLRRPGLSQGKTPHPNGKASPAGASVRS